jgi:hypothetical protein
MIVFRHADPRLPFFWEGGGQPPARWHGSGEGPVQYTCDTPDGAWAEFLRHEEIRAPEDLATIRRALWAIEIDDAEPAARPEAAASTMTGGLATYAACRECARQLRAGGATRIEAPSAALDAGGARGYVVDAGLRPASPRNGCVIVLFGRRPYAVGWRAVHKGYPAEELLGRVRHLQDG